MLIRTKPSALVQTKWWEYTVRFVFGGLSTVLAGLVARDLGPTIGGLFLAFPAIFCASATLVERHERTRKEKLGLRGRKRGLQAAALDAAGAALGSLALIGFGAVIWCIAPTAPVASLVLAAAAWAATAPMMWWLRRHVRLTRVPDHRNDASASSATR